MAVRRKVGRWCGAGALGAVALSVAVVGTAAPPSSAERGSVANEAGDAPARIDLTGLAVANGDRRARMVVEVRDLGEHGRFTLRYWGGRRQSPPARSVLVGVRRVEGETRVRFFHCGREDCSHERCRGLAAEWDAGADVVEVTVPQRCYPRPRREPDAEPPQVARFWASSATPDRTDSTEEPLLLRRG